MAIKGSRGSTGLCLSLWGAETGWIEELVLQGPRKLQNHTLLSLPIALPHWGVIPHPRFLPTPQGPCSLPAYPEPLACRGGVGETKSCPELPG